MNKLPRLAPWFDWEEWTSVFRGLYSDNLLEAVKAIEMVGLWKMRGKVPHSVDSTALLTSISIRESEMSERPAFFARQAIRLEYSIAVIRCVNGLVDGGQQGVFAESVLSLAERLGLPGWIVELRHDATHNDLPSIEVLRAASNQLKCWFREHYWAPQIQHLQSLALACASLPLSSTVPASSPPSSAIESDALLLDSSPTLMSEVLVPLFLEAVAGRPATSRCKSMRDLQEVWAMQKTHWVSQIKRLLSVQGSLLAVLECRLASFGLELLDCWSTSEGGPEATCKWRILTLAFWVKEVGNIAIELGLSRGLGSGFLTPVLTRIRAFRQVSCGKHSQEIARLASELEMAFACEGSVASDGRDNEDNGTPASGASSWRQVENQELWPLGLPPGKCSVNLWACEEDVH